MRRGSLTRGQVRFAVLAVLLAAAPAVAAEIQIRTECRPGGGVVTLGDCADIRSTNPQEATALAELELLPAPPVGQTRLVRAREIQDIMLLRGIHLAQCRFGGSSQLTVYGPDADAVPAAMGPLASTAVKRVERQLREAVLAYLGQVAGADEARQVEFSVADELARRVHAAGGVRAVRGGQPPWSGTQSLEVVLDTGQQPERFRMDVHIQMTPKIVISTRAIPRGAVITSADVVLARHAAGRLPADCFLAVDHVVGSEAVQTIGEGAALDSKMVRTPLLVRRGDIVTVYARNGAIRVRTTARARDDGSRNELVGIETLTDRQVFFAKVSGIRELEIDTPRANAATAAMADRRFSGRVVE